MLELYLQYKRETGLNPKIGFECEMYGDIILNVDADITNHFAFDKDGIIELPTPEYIKWLEEKVNELRGMVRQAHHDKNRQTHQNTVPETQY